MKIKHRTLLLSLLMEAIRTRKRSGSDKSATSASPNELRALVSSSEGISCKSTPNCREGGREGKEGEGREGHGKVKDVSFQVEFETCVSENNNT